MTEARSNIPHHVLCREFLVSGLAHGTPVLDVGCGDGNLMSDLARRGYPVAGVEINCALVRSCRAAGLQVDHGRAEDLNLVDASVDAIVCSVVLPYTDEKLAVAEWGRVLKPGGVVNATFHGLGYAVKQMLHGPGWRKHVYGMRQLANTLFYRITGWRLPGGLGDTLCQTSSRMRSYYAASGLRLEEERVVESVMGSPRFLCHRVVKSGPLAHDSDARPQALVGIDAEPC
jgi:SAM-dependent methyltransferase